MKNLNLKLSKIFAFVTSVFLILALASCSELFSDPEKTGSVSFSLSPEVARAVTSSRSLSGYSFDKTTDFSLKDDDDPNTYIFTVSLSGDYSETQYKSYTEAEFDSLGNGKTITSLGNDSTITFNEIPVGSKVKATVTISITDSTGTYPWYEGTSDTKEILEGTNSIDLKITKKQYTCKFNVYIKGELSSEYSKTLTGDLLSIDEQLANNVQSISEALMEKGYVLNQDKDKLDAWMPKLTGTSTLESSIYFDLPGSTETVPTKCKIEFYLQGDDGNYAPSSTYPAVEFDLPENYDESSIKEFTENEVVDTIVDISLAGYATNNEKTDASINAPEISGDYIVIKFYFDKATGEPGKEEPGVDEPGVDEPGNVYFDKAEEEPSQEEPEAKTIKICFRFQNGEGEYAANDEIPDITMTFVEADEWSAKISENAVKAVEQGYILNEEKTDKEPVLDGDAYFINVYFDKAEEEKANVGGVTVTLAKTSVTDEGTHVKLEVNETSDGLDFTATPVPYEDPETHEMVTVTVTKCMWIVENLTPEDGTDYHIPVHSLEYNKLGFGIKYVTCIVTIDGVEYSASTTFTVKAE